ncbi:MAG: tetratricopeptide repeat protein [Pseudomonadota bacterium]
MSLLMQALRKAESAKKSQGASPEAAAPETPAAPAAPVATPSGELTLEMKEPTREDIATASQVAAEAAAAEAAGHAPASHTEPLPPVAAPEPAVDYFSSEVPPVRAPYVPAEAPAAPQNQGFDPDRGFGASAPVQAAPVAPPPPVAPVAPVAEAIAPTSSRVKVGLEQQKEADNAARKVQEARSAAGAVFAAKQGARNRRPLIIGAVALLLVAAGAFGYFQFMRISQPVVYPQAQVITVPVGPPVGPVAAVAVPLATEPPVAAVVPPAAAVVAPDPAFAAAPRPAAARPRAVASAAPATNTGRRIIVVTPEARPRVSDVARDAAPIAFRRNDGSRQVNPTLSNAYQSFMAGDTAAARSQYQRVLQQEPDNRDALLGMAAIAVNKGQAGEAGSFYTRLLELDPTDAEAGAGLASVQRGDPNQTESNLKKVLAGNPQTGSAHFALGNVYAQQQRWPEAQQAYFQALGATPANADYAFNLAVSLDKLGQKKLALDTYQKALQLAQRGAANVNQVVVNDRIRQLQHEMAAAPRR